MAKENKPVVISPNRDLGDIALQFNEKKELL